MLWRGSNNEKGWWKFFIRPLIGFFQPQKQIPIELIIPNKDVDESFIYLNNIVSKNSISGKTILQGEFIILVQFLVQLIEILEMYLIMVEDLHLSIMKNS